MQMPIMAKGVFIAGFIALAPFRVKLHFPGRHFPDPSSRDVKARRSAHIPSIKNLFNMEQKKRQSPSKEDEKAKFQSQSVTIWTDVPEYPAQ